MASFRVEPGILDKLNKAAKQDGISLNTIVNQALGDYVNWDRPATKSGWIFLKQEIVKSLFVKLNDKEIQNLAIRLAKEIMKDTMLSMTGKYDLETWISITKNRSVKSNFHYQEIRDNGQTSIIIKHSMGLKWSLFHKWYYQQMIKELGLDVKVEYTDKTIVLNIR